MKNRDLNSERVKKHLSEEHQKVIDEITTILFNARQRRLAQEEEKGA